MVDFHNSVSNWDMIDQDHIVTFTLPNTVVDADVGRPIALDTAGPNRAKIAGNDEIIIGRLETVEKRSASQTVGGVSLSGIMRLPLGAAQVVNIGQSVIGHASGVKAATTPNLADNYVIEVIGTTHVVVVKK